MSRDVPMDELLVQLVEMLRSALRLTAAEVWSGTAGVLDRVAIAPHRSGKPRLVLAEAAAVLGQRPTVAGNSWLAVWIPQLLDQRDACLVRAAPVTHRGELLGLIVVERPVGGIAFTDEEDRALAELGRQLGLALHNVRLDSALQASLVELEERNAELQASRTRIVSSADESRRQIERDLHDGVQQHLVALAVKLRVALDLRATEPVRAASLLDEVHTDIDAALAELRELAHGIYPPMLRDRGLAEALRSAALRAPMPTTVEADGVGRYPSGLEAAVYFCCTEAMQNAGKHAGTDARAVITLAVDAGRLTFSVVDDGSGFEAVGAGGQGFVNMRDRLGALGGGLAIMSARGQGTTVQGWVPLPP